MERFRFVLLVLLLALTARAVAQGERQSAQPPTGTPGDGRPVLLTEVSGAIGPATAKQIADAIDAAETRNAPALLLKLNTPGGLVTSTREIIMAILDSDVPVIGYVAPSGAHAASAGTYILLATHAAAMAPATNIGAATPVQMGGNNPLPGPRPAPADPAPPQDADPGPETTPQTGGDSDPATGTAPDSATDAAPETEREAGRETGQETGRETGRAPAPRRGDALEAKRVNDAVAFIRGLADLRGRNADWAEAAVREAATLTAHAARAQNVIDTVAASVPALLTALDGRTVSVKGADRRLSLAGRAVERVEPSLTTRALGVLANPNVAFILMLIGVYGLIFEFSNPGTIGPGVIGAIALVLGLYALNQLPLDYAGLALVGLGIAFMVAEAVSPSFGILGLGGLAGFVIGAAMLVDTDQPAYQLSWAVILTSAAVTGGLLMLILSFAVRSFRVPIRTGRQGLLGATAAVMDWQGDRGHVWIDGARWRARLAPGQSPPVPGARVRVAGLDGLTLTVEPADP
ncbi:hypothetical protein CCR85_01460 [Rhodothalassium salexigens]|uniref:NfeD family protein n=1 Tax=Rhodothalassium salexigens TaxID=1086 RepID=UPI0019114EDE|nr:nodulation protein NfeD [Rhodothalassium salexigens]MBK5910160.1 hypothetical protein [Rhodothalassium salexigens]MBK5920782.1 hypothetical protein [Rhodothalassium salexigens]